jgi:regulator of protease activity HflC (stomatin/prohibitin superfamily)
LEPLLRFILKGLGVFTIVNERQCKVYELFGKVIGVYQEAGLYCLWLSLGPIKALLVQFFGKCHVIDLRIDQEYLRSQPVNSEEGAPIGIGIWYEMLITDPVAYLYRNTNPRGSLGANVSNAVVRCLSNLPLASMLEDRHAMSQAVRSEVSPQSQEWGYSLGSVYIRKVHFRDIGMIKQIEAKVVNRLRQVTAAIKQAGANQVNLITSAADKKSAVEFAKAQALRPKVIGGALAAIGKEPSVLAALLEVLEIQKLIDGKTSITLVPPGQTVLNGVLAAGAQVQRYKTGDNKVEKNIERYS